MDPRIEKSLDSLKKAGLLKEWGGNWDSIPEETSVKSDSRIVGPGDIFACVKGEHADGHRFIQQVLTAGASGLLVQDCLASLPVPWIRVSNVRAAMGYLAAALYGEPSAKLKMYAVTGTQGKSTSSYMVRSILRHCGVRCGLLGTIVYDNGAESVLADRTTPEGSEVQSFLREMVQNHCGACAMECSSHGIVQGRLNGALFDGAIFTNLTPEHLDFHKTMESYFDAKMTLFRHYLKQGAVVAPNMADPYGRRVADEFPSAVTWALETPARLQARNISMDIAGSSFDMLFDSVMIGRVRIPLSGRYNIENALGAAALCLGSGCGEKSVAEGLEQMPQVPGRMERLSLSNGVHVIIDYAHTADALKSLLANIRKLTQGRLISLFGHGGERFAGHRPLLGKAAAQYADHVFVTMDNPRNEDPRRIADQIVEGIRSVRGDSCWTVELSREEAVKSALERCQSGDTLILSGKGPEPYLEIAGVKYPYSDKKAVQTWAHEKGVSVQ